MMKAFTQKMLLGLGLLLLVGIAPLAAVTGRELPSEVDGITQATPTNPEKKDDTSKEKKQKKTKKQKKSKKQKKQDCCGKDTTKCCKQQAAAASCCK